MGQGVAHVAVGKLTPLKTASRITNRKQFGVRGGIVVQNDVVATLTHDHAIANYDRAVCLVSLFDRLLTKRPRPCEKPSLRFLDRLHDGTKFVRLGACPARADQLTGGRNKQPGKNQAPVRIHHGPKEREPSAIAAPPLPQTS
jgi:hypothetical protein